MLASLHAWAFLPDTQAAEAAAEATAMASFTAGSTSSSNAHSGNSGGTTVGLLVASMQGPGGASTVAPFASVAAAVPGAAAAAAPTQPMGHNASGGGAGGSGSGSGSSKAWTGSKAAEAAMLQCLQAAWDDVCARPPRCPGFLLHAQGPAGVAGMQLHLLQLLGGPGQALAERLGWLAELEQQEIQEVLAGPGASTAAATSSCTDVATSGTTAAAAAAAAGTFMGLLGGAGSALGLPAAVGLNAQSPACDISTQQLKQVRLLMCAAAGNVTTASSKMCARVDVQCVLAMSSTHTTKTTQCLHASWGGLALSLTHPAATVVVPARSCHMAANPRAAAPAASAM